jgi:hypothetical protein
MNLSKLSIDILNEQINILKQENLLLKLKIDRAYTIQILGGSLLSNE